MMHKRGAELPQMWLVQNLPPRKQKKFTGQFSAPTAFNWAASAKTINWNNYRFDSEQKKKGLIYKTKIDHLRPICF